MKTLRATAVPMGTAFCAERLEIRNRQEPTGTDRNRQELTGPDRHRHEDTTTSDVFCRVKIRK